MAKLKCKYNFQIDEITDNFYFNYYQFHGPSMLLTGNNTRIIIKPSNIPF